MMRDPAQVQAAVLAEISRAARPLSLALLSERLRHLATRRRLEAALARLQDLGQIVPGPQIPERTWRIL